MIAPKKIYLVTGSTSGIGYETAKALAGAQATVLVHGRNREKIATTRQKIIEATGNTDVVAFTADLSLQSDIREMVAAIRMRYDRLDGLINNAGIWNSKFERTEDGIESVIAINHLACFLLTHLLYPLLRRSTNGRVITVASDSHFQAKKGLYDSLELENNYHGLRSYAQSKLANVLFTYELERRKPDPQVSCYAVQPGLVHTDIGMKHAHWLHALAWRIRRNMSGRKSPAEGAATSIHLATEPAVSNESGQYWDNCRAKPSSKASYDLLQAERLWNKSLEWCGIEAYFPTDK